MAEAQALGQHKGQALGIGRWLALAVTALLAACQVVPKQPPKPIERPTEERLDTGQLPTDATRHRIALLVPLTGTNAGVGESIANAANMAVLDTGGKNIRVTTYDTATGAAAAAQKAVADGNKLILGPLLAEDVKAVAPIGRAARIPLISFSNDTSVAGNGVFILGFVPTQSVDRVVRYARSRGLVTFAGLVPNGTYGQRASQAMIRAVEASGGKLIAMQNFDRSAGSISAAVTKLALNGQYDAILIADSGRVALQIVPAIRRSGGATAKVLGTELWNTEGSLANSPAMQGAWFASVSDSYYNQLSIKYRARFGKGPYRLASLGYDAVLLANKIAGGWRVGAPFPVAQLTDEGGFSGIDGAFRFGRDGIADRMLEVQQINATGFAVVAPAPRSFSK
jgi:ABC-type branched-subunit amino acid transport system substrate-binding protein